MRIDINCHDRYLNELCWRLKDIDEDIYKVKWIMKDGIWMVDNSVDMRELCDLIIVYDGYGVPVELKGSMDKRNKATSQITSGSRFITDELGLDCSYGKFVVYNKDKYIWEIVALREM
jgi:hypothetical protein